MDRRCLQRNPKPDSKASSRSPGPRATPWRGAVALLGAAALAGCQSYEPRPLDPEAHRTAWRSRTLEVESLGQFLDRLELEVESDAAELRLGDGVELAEAQVIALFFNRELRLARLRVGREAAGAEFAGLWDDPRFSFRVLRVTENVPDRWVVEPGLAFSIPISGRLGAQQDLADSELRAARGAALEAEWSVWYEVERAWIGWSAARLRAEETQRLVDSMDALVQMVAQLAEQGEIQRTAATLFLLEQTRRRNQLYRLEGEVAAAEQRIRSLMGLLPSAPVELRPAIGGGALASSPPAPGLDAIEACNPGLARLRQEYAVAEQALRREIKRQYPDLTLGPVFESDQGQSRIGFFGGLPLPFLNANRRGIAEARAEREIARVAVETAFESLAGRWAAASARSAALTEQRRDMERTVIPLVDRQLEDAFELMRLGEVATLVLLESLTRAFQAKLDLIEARSAEAAARAEAAFLVGPEASRQPSEPTETSR